MTPGLVAAGGGNKAQPLFGAGGVGAKRLMKWAWVRCLACNPPDDARKAGAVYKHLNLSDAQIAQRAQMANMRASYQPEVKESLGKLAGNRPSVSPHAQGDDRRLSETMEQNKQLNGRLDELLKQNAEMTQTLSRMSMQIAALLEDNAKLRSAQNASAVTPTGQ
jgi:chromosome segregation ATPase